MQKRITVIAGDGIGPEITAQAVKALQRVARVFRHGFSFQEVLAGGCAYDAYGTPLPQDTLSACLNNDAVLLGAVGGPQWEKVDKQLRPERALLAIRKEMGLYQNMRPAKIFYELRSKSPLKREIVERGIDLLMMRELTGGIYFGTHQTREENGIKQARDVMAYNAQEIERIGRAAFAAAKKRRNRVCSVDKANVLDTSRLWREVMHRIAAENPGVEYQDMLVDNAAMQLLKDPSQFDVMVTENMFGDILSDEASEITGSIGMIPSASMGKGRVGMYEPVHGSAPDIAGKDLANPIGTVLSAAMMLRYSFEMEQEAERIEQAVEGVLKEGYRTQDIYEQGDILVGCEQMGNLIEERI